jgi:hypothetical protein
MEPQTPMSTAALFTMAEVWNQNQHRCPSSDERIMKNIGYVDKGVLFSKKKE